MTQNATAKKRRRSIFMPPFRTSEIVRARVKCSSPVAASLCEGICLAPKALVCTGRNGHKCAGIPGCIEKRWKHHRTPKRKRNYGVENGGHVLECGSVLPLFERTRLSIAALSSRSPPLGLRFCQSSGYVDASQWHPGRFEVEDFAKQVPAKRQ